jgi:hypothetical protein
MIKLPTLRTSQRHSLAMIERARTEIDKLDLPWDHMCVVALGSYGRLEAQADVSDYEWLVVSDDRYVSTQEAIVAQAHLTKLFAELFGRERLSVNKTFGPLCDFSDLGAFVGGLSETNQMLTYRVLILTEGLPLSPGSGYQRTIRALAGVYGRSHTAGHRLLSLPNELARYYRAVRAAYKYKVDDEGKPWAVRSIKNRAYRRMAFFTSAIHFVAFGPRIDYTQKRLFDLNDVAEFMKAMSTAPIDRYSKALTAINASVKLFYEPLDIYERIHAALASSVTRGHLDTLESIDRYNDSVYSPIHADCVALQSSLAAVVAQLPDNARSQLVEMFLL